MYSWLSLTNDAIMKVVKTVSQNVALWQLGSMWDKLLLHQAFWGLAVGDDNDMILCIDTDYYDEYLQHVPSQAYDIMGFLLEKNRLMQTERHYMCFSIWSFTKVPRVPVPLSVDYKYQLQWIESPPSPTSTLHYRWRYLDGIKRIIRLNCVLPTSKEGGGELIKLIKEVDYNHTT